MLDMIYALMIRNIGFDPDGKRDYRKELDQALGVREWVAPGRPKPKASRPTNAPDWWEDEEEASNSFLAAMGIQL